VLEVLEYFRQERGTIPVSQVCAFIRVALEEGENVNHYTAKIGSAQSVVSRHLLDLADALRNGEPGLGLITRRLAPTSARDVQYFLTAKGKHWLARIIDIMRRR
jgi:DNA-binding MarR family transcriptional regulator